MRKIVIIFILILGFTFFLSYSKNKKSIVSSPTPPTKVLPKSHDADTTLTIAAAGDIACDFTTSGNECKDKETAKLVEDAKPDLVLALGDLQYESGNYESFLAFFDKSWGKFKSITKPAPGNHDSEEPAASGYVRYFGNVPDYYSFDKGPWHFIALDSDCWAVGGCGEDSKQYKWLQEDLSKSKTYCTLAFWHHPLYSSGQHGDNVFMEDMWDLLYQHSADVVLNGHDHVYERFAKYGLGKKDEKGIREFIVGTGGRNLYSFTNIHDFSEKRINTDYGILIMKLKDSGYEWQFKSISGKILDAGSDSCS